MVLGDRCAAGLMIFGTRAVVMLRGDLDAGTATQIRTYLDRVLRLQPRAVTVSLEELRTCDDCGVALLVEYKRRAEREGWTFRLRAASAGLVGVLERVRAAQR